MLELYLFFGALVVLLMLAVFTEFSKAAQLPMTARADLWISVVLLGMFTLLLLLALLVTW